MSDIVQVIEENPCSEDLCGLEHSCPANDEQNTCAYLENWVLNNNKKDNGGKSNAK